MDKLELLPDKPLDFKYIVIGRYDTNSYNIHMGAGRTKKEILKISRLNKHWVDKAIYKREDIK